MDEIERFINGEKFYPKWLKPESISVVMARIMAAGKPDREPVEHREMSAAELDELKNDSFRHY